MLQREVQRAQIKVTQRRLGLRVNLILLLQDPVAAAKVIQNLRLQVEVQVQKVIHQEVVLDQAVAQVEQKAQVVAEAVEAGVKDNEIV